MRDMDLDAARRHHAALKHLLIRHPGGGADVRTLRRVLALCEALGAAADDAYCHEKLRRVGDYAAEMLAHGDHAKWASDALSGTEFLRQQVLNALELLASRLYSLEALRRAAARNQGGPRWTTRSNIAQI